MNDVVMPLGERLGVNVVPGAGDMSATQCRNFVARARESGQPVIILYVSDFDPQGENMPCAVARKIEFDLRKLAEDLNVQVRAVALTHEQCVQYALPRIPLKDTERRAPGWEARYGEGQTELDALEAIHPGMLERILRHEIERYRDPTLVARMGQATREFERDLGVINTEIRARHAAEIDEVRAAERTAEEEVNQLQAEAERIIDRLREQEERALAPIRERMSELVTGLRDLAQPVIKTMRRELEEEAPDPDTYDWPEAKEPDEDDDPLYHSRRGYLEQLDRYHKHQGKAKPKKLFARRSYPCVCEKCGENFTSTKVKATLCKRCYMNQWRREKRAEGKAKLARVAAR
jgi:hypothetical protein